MLILTLMMACRFHLTKLTTQGAAACQVMETLRTLAHDGCTVVVSIHQPRSSIFEMFDDLVLLSEGGLVLTSLR